MSICACCTAFRHGLYHPYELLEVKAHWSQIVFSLMSYILVLHGHIWCWWGSLVQWKCVLDGWRCPSQLAVSYVIIKSLLLFRLCWQKLISFLTNPTVCRDLSHAGLHCMYMQYDHMVLLLSPWICIAVSDTSLNKYYRQDKFPSAGENNFRTSSNFCTNYSSYSFSIPKCKR